MGHRYRVSMDAPRRAQMLERLRSLKTVARAREEISEVLTILVNAESDEQALNELQNLLGCDRESAERVLTMQLRLFRTKPIDIISAEIVDLESQLEARDS